MKRRWYLYADEARVRVAVVNRLRGESRVYWGEPGSHEEAYRRSISEIDAAMRRIGVKRVGVLVTDGPGSGKYGRLGEAFERLKNVV